MKKGYIAKTVRQIMIDSNEQYIWFGSVEILDKCTDVLQLNHIHPLVRAKRILDAVDRSSYFLKKYMMVEINGKMRKVRCFCLC